MMGVIGVFRELDSVVEAIHALKQARLPLTAYTPTPRHEIDEALAHEPSVVRRFTLIGGLLGATFGYWVAIWISVDWSLVVGGKPIASWVPYTIISFEMMVLVGALSTVFGMFINARLPKITATIGYDPRFSHGDYGIWVPCPPEKAAEVESMLREHGAQEVRRER
jgi:hypothetical protein